MDRCVGAAARLPQSDRKNLAIQALAQSATVSDLAARHGVSRKFVYQQTRKAAWFRICPFWVTRGARKPLACEGRVATGRVGPMREAAGLPGSGSLGLKRSQAQQGQPVRMALAGHQFPRALAVAFGTPAAHEASVVQEEPQQVQMRAAQVAAQGEGPPTRTTSHISLWCGRSASPSWSAARPPAWGLPTFHLVRLAATQPPSSASAEGWLPPPQGLRMRFLSPAAS